MLRRPNDTRDGTGLPTAELHFLASLCYSLPCTSARFTVKVSVETLWKDHRSLTAFIRIFFII